MVDELPKKKDEKKDEKKATPQAPPLPPKPAGVPRVPAPAAVKDAGQKAVETVKAAPAPVHAPPTPATKEAAQKASDALRAAVQASKKEPAKPAAQAQPAAAPAPPKKEERKETPKPAEAKKKDEKKAARPGSEKKGERKAEEKEPKAQKKEKHKARQQPELTPEARRGLELRRTLKDRTPNFIRQEAYNYVRVGDSWRRPRGTHSKLRHHFKARINVVSIGYGGPSVSKGMHPSGFREVLVHHPKELDKVNPKTEAARIAHGVGTRKREMIERRAERMGIRILNQMS